MNRVAIAGLALCVLGGPAVCAQMEAEAPATASAALPTGFEVLARAVEALGGEKRLREIKSTRYAGKFEMRVPGMPQELSGTIQILRQAPNKQRVLVDLQPLGKVDQGTDGKSAWVMQPGQALQMLEGDALKKEIADAAFYSRLEPQARFTSAETQGRVDVNGESCYELVLTDSIGGEVSTEFYSVESGLRLKSVTGPQTVTYSDYKEFEGSVVPCRLDISVQIGEQSMQQLIILAEVEIDPELSFDAFDAPGSF